jgi:hypothetical protein
VNVNITVCGYSSSKRPEPQGERKHTKAKVPFVLTLPFTPFVLVLPAKILEKWVERHREMPGPGLLC